MVLVFDTTLTGDLWVGFTLEGGPGPVSVDWGGPGIAHPVGTGGSASQQTQTYDAAPGPTGFGYTSAGSYTVKLCGHIRGFHSLDQKSLIKVTDFGTLGITDYSSAFMGATNLQSVPADLPTGVTNMSYMFASDSALTGHLGGWDTSSVLDMSHMFEFAVGFNDDIAGWDTGNVRDMSYMFAGDETFNKKIGGWNTKDVASMTHMFHAALAFNQNIGGWDTSAVADMSWMFWSAASFNQDLAGWDTGNVTNMNTMFSSADAFNGKIGDWDTSNVTDMSWMFWYAKSFNRSLGAWNTSQVTNMTETFSNAGSFNQDIGGWDTGEVTEMEGMFGNAHQFNQKIGGWDTRKVTTMASMFDGASSFNQNIAAWNTSRVIDLSGMFYGASRFNQRVGSWDTRSATDMSYAFYVAKAFNQDLGGWDVRGVRSMDEMFKGVTLSTINYDALLNGWAGQSVQPRVTFGGGGSKYSSAARLARLSLMHTHGWTISDGGFVSLRKFSSTHAPSLSGSARVGKTLTAKMKAWSPRAKWSYQWLRDGVAIDGAIKSKYVLNAGDLGSRVSVRLTGTRTAYASTMRTSRTVLVKAGKLVAGKVKITGIRSVSNSLLALTYSKWSTGVKFTYQWYRNGEAISSATSSSYVLADVDRGASIKVKAIATKAGYDPVSAFSASLRVS